MNKKLNKEQSLHKEVEMPTWRTGSKCSCGKTFGNQDLLNQHRGEELGDRVIELQDAFDAMIFWLMDQLSYPYDMRTETPIPEAFREPLISAWFLKDECDEHGRPKSDTTLEDYRLTIAEEGGWL